MDRALFILTRLHHRGWVLILRTRTLEAPGRPSSNGSPFRITAMILAVTAVLPILGQAGLVDLASRAVSVVPPVLRL